MVLEIDGLTKSYHRRKILDSVGFSLRAGEFFSIIGPSGSGKTTLLKIIAGLETPDYGSIRFEKTPDRKSPVILVFQDLQLFPHLSVYENVAFGLRVRKMAKTEIDKKVSEVLPRLGISGRVKAYPADLSGGEQQRTALARALVLDPQLLLLDEPFSNLDPNMKGEAALLIRETTQAWDTPVICVTHDFEEAFSMSDRIGVLLDSRLVQTGPPRNVFLNPVSLEAARFMGPVNHVPPDLARELLVPCTIRSQPGEPGIPRPGIAFSPKGRGKMLSRDLFLLPEALEFVPNSDGDAVLVMPCFLGHRILHIIQWRGNRWEAAGASLDLPLGTRGTLIFHIEGIEKNT